MFGHGHHGHGDSCAVFKLYWVGLPKILTCRTTGTLNMARIATTTFLNDLRAHYSKVASGKNHELQNPWHFVAAVAFSASNHPEAVPIVFRHALRELNDVHEERLLLARKMRDALFKAGLICGYPRAINGLTALHEAIPPELRDTKLLRDTRIPIETHERRGSILFRSLYGESANMVQSHLDSIYPDMGWFSNTIGYGITYGYDTVTSPLETSYAIVAALIVGDTPQQITWHMNNARRVGATAEEIKAVRKISMEVASRTGVQWKKGVPEVGN